MPANGTQAQRPAGDGLAMIVRIGQDTAGFACGAKLLSSLRSSGAACLDVWAFPARTSTARTKRKFANM